MIKGQPSKKTIMAHCVSHFPNEDISFNVALALAEAGASYLEIQFPFSDPYADGTLIQTACSVALKEPGAFNVKKGFELVGKISQTITMKNISTSIFLMCYGNMLVAYGVDTFIRQAKQKGVQGLIIPDIPCYSDVGLAIQKACTLYDVAYIPVLVVTSKKNRIQYILKTCMSQYVYISLRTGITGTKTTITDELISFLSDDIFASTHILGGFGIQDASQVQMLSPYVHACVIGSAFVRTIIDSHEKKQNVALSVKNLCEKFLSSTK